MTTNPPILRNSALALPVAVGVGLYMGPLYAVAAALSGLVVLGNLWVLSVLGPRLIQSVADDEFPVLWVAALSAKFFLLLGLVWGMLQFLPPLGVALGFVPLLVGTLVTAVQLARHETHEAMQGDV